MQAVGARYHHPRLHGGVDQRELLIGSIAAAALESGDDFNARGIMDLGVNLVPMVAPGVSG
jgi:hypothetical protein